MKESTKSSVYIKTKSVIKWLPVALILYSSLGFFAHSSDITYSLIAQEDADERCKTIGDIAETLNSDKNVLEKHLIKSGMVLTAITTNIVPTFSVEYFFSIECHNFILAN